MSTSYACAEELLQFIERCPSPFHTVEATKELLQEQGYQELSEADSWKIAPGGKYFVTRNHTAVIAFAIPKGPYRGFHMTAAHSDSPAFRLKENPEMPFQVAYTRLNVEKYGAMLMQTWLDRPLSVAGRVFVDTEEGLQERLIRIEEDLMVIPNLAIHMNREANEGVKLSTQTDMCPVIAATGSPDMFRKRIALEADTQPEHILGQDLYLYTRQRGVLLGMEKDMILSPRLDDLECVYGTARAFAESEPSCYINVCAVLDNEEVGSATRQGADSDFLYHTLKRIVYGLGGSEEEYMRLLAESFLISADNAHAVHPNHPEKADPVNRPVLNGGIVIKYSSNQKYTTDAYSGSVMKKLCMEANVPYQIFYNHSDVLGGSTLGNISSGHVSVAAADIGLAQLAMHSAVETAGVKDIGYLIQVMKHYFA